MAARGLLEQGAAHSTVARETLKKLTASNDLTTACLARVSLLGAGHLEFKDDLTEVAGDPSTPSDMLELMLAYIEHQEIAEACEVARRVAVSRRPLQLRVQAYTPGSY